MERIKDLLSFFIAAMAMVSLLCAVYQAMNERISSAITLAGMFFIATALFYLPKMEMLSAYGIEVRLRNTLNRAEEIIERLKKLAEVNAKATYMNVAWGNRMGSPSTAEKQKLLDETDAQLRALKVDEAERQQIAKPLIELTGVDMYSAYSRIMDRLVFWLNQSLNRKLKGNGSAEAIAERQRFADAAAEWRKANAGQTPYRDRENYDLDAYLRRDIPIALLSEAQKSKAETFREQVLSLYDACKKKGGYTREATEFLDEYNGENALGAADKKVKEFFGMDTSPE